MNKTAKLLAAGLTVAILLSACSAKSGKSEPTSEDDGDYGNIKTVLTPAGFTGNTGDVTIESGDTYAVITIQDFGEITVKLFPEAAPEGVQIFTDLANSGYYSGKEIHRVAADFVIQGGSANGDGMTVQDEPKFSIEYNTNMRSYYGALCFANANSVNGSQFFIVNRNSYTQMPESYEKDLNEYMEYMDGEISLCEEALAAAVKEEDIAYFEYYIELYTAWRCSAASQLRALNEMTVEIETKYTEVGGDPRLDGAHTVFGQTVDGFDVIDALNAVEVEQQPNMDELSHPVQPIIIQSVEIFTA